MEAIGFFKTLVSGDQTTRCHVVAGSNHHSNCHENLKFRKAITSEMFNFGFSGLDFNEFCKYF